MRQIVSAVLGAAAVGTYLTVVPLHDTELLVRRLLPILLFLTTISVVVNLSARAGVFSHVATIAARQARGRNMALWLIVVAISVVSTAFLSLDTTAVLVTPLVMALARASGSDSTALAFTVVWLANIGSLFLPVSNLTNLLAAETARFSSTGEFIGVAWASASAAVAVTVVFSYMVFHRHLRGRHELRMDGIELPRHQLLGVCAGVLCLLLPMLTTSVPFFWSTSAAAVVLFAAFCQFDRQSVKLSLVPWPAIGLATGLILAVQLIQSLGVDAALVEALTTTNPESAGLFRLAVAGALTSNLMNNLPAYLLLEPAAGSSKDLVALLIGTNAGSIITPWASLATLLWADQVRREGVTVSWWKFAGLGAVLMPLVVGTSTLVLVLATPP